VLTPYSGLAAAEVVIGAFSSKSVTKYAYRAKPLHIRRGTVALCLFLPYPRLLLPYPRLLLPYPRLFLPGACSCRVRPMRRHANAEKSRNFVI